MEEKERNKTEASTLYLVATPIGNRADLSERAVKVLSEVDFIAAEDTRNTMRLLDMLNIRKPMVSYFEHNKKERGEQIIARLRNGESCALVTDAGTPAISDPGEDLVVLCAENDVRVTSIPGCCASITALTLSALPTARFTFEGFLPMEKKDRRIRLEELSLEKRTMLFHEAPHKLRATLADFCTAFGENRRISLCRELTKLNEEVLRMTLGEANAYYAENDPRGEYVLVVEGKTDDSTNSAFWEALSVEAHVRHYMDMGHSKNDAIKAAAKDRGVPKNTVYQEMIGKD
jgi:16S rRNA (cytidine1402-2'-O)-methyltransferase